MEKLFSFRKHPLAFTAISIVALLLLVFAVARGNVDIRSRAGEPVTRSLDMNLSEAIIIYCRGERMSIDPPEMNEDSATFVCLGSLVDAGDPSIRETGADRFVIMSPDDITTLSCQGRFERFSLKEGVGYQIFCN